MAIADDFASIQKRRRELGYEAWPSKPVENIIPPNLQPYFWGSFPVAMTDSYAVRDEATDRLKQCTREEYMAVVTGADKPLIAGELIYPYEFGTVDRNGNLR